MSERISTSNAPKPVGLYPHARRVGNLLFLSGVGPRTAGSDANDSGVPGLELDHNGNFKAFDFEAQVHSVFANVKSILEASGSSWEQLVDVTVFLVGSERANRCSPRQRRTQQGGMTFHSVQFSTMLVERNKI